MLRIQRPIPEGGLGTRLDSAAHCGTTLSLLLLPRCWSGYFVWCVPDDMRGPNGNSSGAGDGADAQRRANALALCASTRRSIYRAGLAQGRRSAIPRHHVALIAVGRIGISATQHSTAVHWPSESGNRLSIATFGKRPDCLQNTMLWLPWRRPDRRRRSLPVTCASALPQGRTGGETLVRLAQVSRPWETYLPGYSRT